MPYDVIIGRSESKKEELGKKATIFLGKQYIKMGRTTDLSNNLYLDTSTSHVILVCGKRGTGKSTTLGVIAEGISKLPKEVRQNMSVLILDTLGIFWSMKYPNLRQEELLTEWELPPEPFDVEVYTPKGKFKDYKKRGIPTDSSFSLNIKDLSADEWCNLFNINFLSPPGVLISRIIEEKQPTSLNQIINLIKKDKTDKTTKAIVENLFKTASGWGILDEKGTSLNNLLKPGQISILDLSCYHNWNIKTMVMGILGKLILQQRMELRKLEEMEMLKRQKDYFNIEETKRPLPLLWILLDEGHEFLPRERITPATNSMVQILREGRQPGITTIIATQQPGEINKDVITQSDIVISHRITAKADINALEAIMQTYVSQDITSHLNNLPALKGSAIILDDNSERIFPMRVHPRQSWHGGEAPSSVISRKPKLNLGL